MAHKMRPEAKEAWIKALRSGEYEQGECYLKQTNGKPKYCCLGVLCEITPDFSWGVKGEDDWTDPETATLPKQVANYIFTPRWSSTKAGNPECNPKIPEASYSLSEWNDEGTEDTSEPLTFSQIADELEKATHLE